MTDTNKYQERLELTFRSKDTGLFGRSSRFWNEALGSTVGKVATSVRGEKIATYITPEASLFVSDRRVEMLGSSPRWFDGALNLITKTSDLSLEGLVYQMLGCSEPNSREFRRRIGLIREQAGEQIGAAVVADGTALFFPTPKKTRVSAERICLQVSMRKLGARVENLLHRPSYAQRQVGINALGLKDAFADFSLIEHHTLDRYCLSGISGNEYFSIQILMREPVSSAVFEYNGKGVFEAGQVLQRLLLTLAPKGHKVVALHSGGVSHLPVLAGSRWQPLSLGLNDAISILSLGDDRAKIQATA